jgi:hypothetical protein
MRRARYFGQPLAHDVGVDGDEIAREVAIVCECPERVRGARAAASVNLGRYGQPP